MAKILTTPENPSTRPPQEFDVAATVRRQAEEYRRGLVFAHRKGEIGDGVYDAKISLLERIERKYMEEHNLLSDGLQDDRDMILSMTQQAIVREHEFEKIDTERLIERYRTTVERLRGSLRAYRARRDADAQFLRTLADDVRGMTGAPTERESHDRSYEAIKSEARGYIASLDRVVSDRKLTWEQSIRYAQIRADLVRCMTDELGEVNPLLSLGNSLHAMGEGNKHLANAGADVIVEGTKGWRKDDRIGVGVMAGALRLVGDVVTMPTDLTALVLRLVGSSEHRDRAMELLGKMTEYVRDHGIPWDIASEKIVETYSRISDLPAEQQADKYTRIIGNIAAVFAVAGVASSLGKVSAGAEEMGRTLSLAASLARSEGNIAEATRLVALAGAETSSAIVLRIGAFVLNGPAESVLGTACTRSLRLVSMTLRGGASAPHKLRTIENTIRDLDAAISAEADPKRLEYLRQARNACEEERVKLIDTGEFARVEWHPETKTLRVQNVFGRTPAEIEQNISRILSRYAPEHIEFTEGIPSEVKRAFADILSRNHPLLEILRLVPGHDVVNVNFRGTKDFNTLFGSAAYDDFLATFKSIVRCRMELHTSQTSGHSRITRNDYKNMTISDPKGKEFIDAVFGADPVARQALIDEAIAAHRDAIERLAATRGVSAESIAKEMRDTFKFSVDHAHISERGTSDDLIRAFYEAEMKSRGIAPRVGETFEQAQQRMATEVFEREADFARQFGRQSFTADDGVRYPMTVRLSTGEQIIHPTLLRLVRKGETTGLDKTVVEAVEGYIRTLNDGFDFIAPFRNFSRDFARAQEINRSFQSGRVATRDLLKNYKGTYTRDALAAMAEGQEGIKIFIDIIDMGIMNLASFRNLARKSLKGEASPHDLISAGGDVTERFAQFVQAIETKYPGARLSLGGDEVFIFIPGKTPAETSSILSEIGRSLTKTDLRGRIAHSFETRDVRSVFYGLDSQTKVNKIIEKVLPESRATHVSLPEDMSAIQAITLLKDPSVKTFLQWLSGVAERIKIGTRELIAHISETGVYEVSFSH